MAYQQDEFNCLQDSSRPNSSIASIASALPSPQIKVYDDLDCAGGHLMLPSTDESKGSLMLLSRRFVSSGLCLKKIEKIINNWARNRLFPVFLNILYTDMVKVNITHDVLIKHEGRYVAEKVQNYRRRQGLIKRATQRFISFAGLIARDGRAKELAGKIIEEKQNSNSFEPPSINQVNVSTRTGRSKGRCSVGIASLVVINLVSEIVSAVADQLSTIRRPVFSRLSLIMSVLSVVLSIIDLTIKIRVNKVCFRCKWPIPWFYYPSRGYNRIFESFTDMVLLFCGVGQVIVSAVKCSFIQRGRENPIKISVWPLFFAIGMVCSKFMEKPAILKEN